MFKRFTCFALACLLLMICTACGQQPLSDGAPDGSISSSQFADNGEQMTTKATQLLGENNAFLQMYQAAILDEQSYEDDLTEMMFILTDAFCTARLGTNQAQAAIAGLIPESVYTEEDTAEDMLMAIHAYAYEDKLNRYFTIDFDSDGNPYSVRINLDNISAFITDAVASHCFTGTTTKFEMNETLTDLSVLCGRMNITREVAVTFLGIIDEYNVDWIAGKPDKMLDQFEK